MRTIIITTRRDKGISTPTTLKKPTVLRRSTRTREIMIRISMIEEVGSERNDWMTLRRLKIATNAAAKD
jgi:hypothetical protein